MQQYKCLFQIKNLTNNKFYLTIYQNKEFFYNSQIHKLNNNKHRNKELQKDWNEKHNFKIDIIAHNINEILVQQYKILKLNNNYYS